MCGVAVEEAVLVCGVRGAHGGYETAEVRDVRKNGERCSYVRGQEKEWIGCFLDDLKAFGINADHWTTAAQDKGEWWQNKGWNVSWRNGPLQRSQGWTTACSSMSERDGK